MIRVPPRVRVGAFLVACGPPVDVGETRLAEIAAELAGLGRGNILAPLVTAEDVAAAWEALGLDLKRAVVDTLMTVTLYPSGRGARTFDPGKVLPPGQGIKWKAVGG